MPKIIEHYRHALRTKPSPHLNEKGVKIARKVGSKLGPYDLVVTSPKWRAVETAVAMGFAVDETIEFWEDIPSKVNDLVSYDAGFKKFHEGIEKNPEIRRYLTRMKKELLSLTKRIPKNGKLLLVSHGGLIEWSAFSLLGDQPKAWGKPIDKCEGIRFEFNNDGTVTGKILRL